MALTLNMMEQLAEWCTTSDTIADNRASARRDFFGYDEPGDVNYMPGVEDLNSRERRFIGWFGFHFRLHDGQHPAELAARAILDRSTLNSALESIKSARYIMAVVTFVNPGSGIYLKLEDEEFEVSSRVLSRVLQVDDSLFVHLLPIGRGRWLPAPGWLLWPIRIGPGMQPHLKEFQLNPIAVERFLQKRRDKSSKKPPKIEQPRDKSLKAAVARMSAAAQAAGQQKLIMRPSEWQDIILPYLTSGDFNSLIQNITDRIDGDQSVEGLNKWLPLAVNIWNNTPQPDRGGKTAQEQSPFTQNDNDVILG